MTDRDALLSAIAREPADDLAWLALADWLEDDGQEPRAEVLRLTRRLLAMGRTDAERPPAEARVCGLLHAGVEPCVPEAAVRGLGMRLVLIPAGRYWRGEEEVKIDRPFWLGKYPVTQGEFEQVRQDENPSYHRNYPGSTFYRFGPSTLPVERVREVGEFLTHLRRRTASVPRLPTPQQWEYACRGGLTAAYGLGPGLTSMLGNYDTSPDGVRPLGETCPVGCYPANAFGLHDMHGNVWERCDADPAVYGGGSFRSGPVGCSPTHLPPDAVQWLDDDGYGLPPDPELDNDLGFRVLLEWTP